MLCSHHKKYAKSHEQSHFTSKFTLSSIHGIFKFDGLCLTMQGFSQVTGKSQILRDLEEQIRGKISQFRDNFWSKLHEKQSVKTANFMLIFREN